MQGRPLKIAMMVRAFAGDGGLELYAHELVNNLLNGGHEVTVFCQSKRSDLSHPKLSFVPMKRRSDDLPKSSRLLHDHRAANLALAELATEFDVVHSQHYPTSLANVVTFHNHTVHRWSEVGLSWERAINELKSAMVPAYHLRDIYDRELCRRASCLVFPSHVMQEDYYDVYEFLQDQDKPFVVAYPGASLKGTVSGGAQRSLHKPFTFLFVGRGFRRKGLDLVLDACKHLRSIGRDFRLLIAGLQEKPLDTMRLRTMGLESIVSYLGFRNDMESVYAMADAAVLPSRVEPFGMAPLQAMSYGLVSIVSRVSGVAEVLSHERDCLVLDNHLDSRELAFHMARLMDEPRLLAELSKNAPATAQRLNWQRTTDRTLEAYAIATANRPKAAAVK